MKIIFKTEIVPDLEEIIDLYDQSGYFPIEERTNLARIKQMHDSADIVISAWHQNKLIGLSRAISDFCYCCYLSDICVRNKYKRQGIGHRLIQLTKEMAGKECKLILQSSPNAIEFYSKIGMEQINSAFIIQREY